MWFHLALHSVQVSSIEDFFFFFLLRITQMPSTKKGKAAPLQERRMSYRRGRNDRFGKPDGGNCGRGGDIILECSSAVWDVSGLQHHLNAKKGGNWVSKNKTGSRGSDKVVQVPVGTVVHLVSGEVPSLVQDISTKSLHPREIPDADGVGPSESLHHNDNRVTTSGLLEEEDNNDSAPCFNNYVGKSARLHYKAAKSRGSGESVSEICLNGHIPHNGAENRRVYATECYEDKFEMEVEEEGEGVGEEEEEEEEEEGEGRKGEGDEEEIQYSVAELTRPRQRLIVARGEGGLGNVALSKESQDNKPNNGDPAGREMLDDDDSAPSTTGIPGSEAVLILEFKSIAVVGLVGMPNVGKSTLLGAISKAKPTVGHYAFTTLRPNIGNLNYDDYFSMTVADILGLIKGAHENRSLGHAFLRHIERTRVLVYVVDLAVALDHKKGIAPWEQLRDLVLEPEYYHPIYPVRAVLEEGVPELKVGLRRLMDGSEWQKLNIDNIVID